MATQAKNVQKQSSINRKNVQKATNQNNPTSFSKNKHWFYIAAIILTFIISFSYIFDKKLNLGGDNTTYYMLSQSIVGGHGYVDVGDINMPKTNSFPPGYPLIMSIVMFFTDSIIPQKILNGILFLIATIILFFFVKKCTKSNNLAFVASIVVVLNASVLSFATIMMSEASFILFSAITLYLLTCLKDDRPFYKDKYFYLLAATVAYAVLIRAQGLALVVGVILYFLFNKKWWHSLGFVAGYLAFAAPWMIRNHLAGINGRYVEQALMVNMFRPEEGSVTLGQFVSRFFETLWMLISKALPSMMGPYKQIDISVPATFSNAAIGIILLVIIGIGFWQFRKQKFFFYLYILASVGILCSCSWMLISGGRYLITLVSFLEIGLVVGICAIFNWIFVKMKSQLKFSPLILLILCFFAFPRLKELHASAKQVFPQSFRNFFAIAKQMDTEELHKKVVSVRKPSLFYVYSHGYVCGYAYSSDRKVVVQGLVDSKADYVVLEQLGYASTGLYLYPAIQNNPELFEVVTHIPDPDTYLLKFDKEKAVEMLKNNTIK